VDNPQVGKTTMNPVVYCTGLSENKRELTTSCDEGRKYHPDVDTEMEDSSVDR